MKLQEKPQYVRWLNSLTPPLETVFPPGNQWHDRIFYDPVEGSYYDRFADVFISLDEAKAFGLPA